MKWHKTELKALISLSQHADGRLAGTRALATPLRPQIEDVLSSGDDAVLDFSGIGATQSFIDELIGHLILSRGPMVLEHIVFRGCCENLRAIIEFVAADRADQYLKAHTQ